MNTEKLLDYDDERKYIENGKADESSKLVEDDNNVEINHKENLIETTAEGGNHIRRNDEPTELSFEKFEENKEEKLKRLEIEEALRDPTTTLEQWRKFALSDYGLVNDDLRRKVWPLLVSIDPASVEPGPKLDDLKTHPEYNQVVLDVNRSLKRFPPGIPYEQRVALQDQLTILILRVIMKYPHLKYYQGYHDVAVTFLLVVGEEVAFSVMEVLSTNHLVECMQETMEPTQRRLMFIYPIINYENSKLCDFLENSTVGTLFALPWYLTWFGHSLNSYRSVVRLYDYFLASDYLLPLYVTAAIVLYRDDEIFKEDCDIASMHCLLSKIPEDLPFEYLMSYASKLYKKYPPDMVEPEVEKMIAKEKLQKIRDDAEAKRRQALRKNVSRKPARNHLFSIFTRRSVFVTTAFSIIVGICAYYYKAHLLSVSVR